MSEPSLPSDSVSVNDLPPDHRDEFARVEAAFARNHDLCKVAYDLIRRGERVDVAVGHLPPDTAASFRDALEAQCRMVWGRNPTWHQTPDVWTLIPPDGPPLPPPFCGSCGGVLSPTSSSLRWGSPGRAALQGLCGWEHQCNPREPQAGHFPADMDTPHATDPAKALAYEADRMTWWRAAAERRARDSAPVMKWLRDRDCGHLFVSEAGTPAYCRQCGLGMVAFKVIPDDQKWRCPGDPALAVATPADAGRN